MRAVPTPTMRSSLLALAAMAALVSADCQSDYDTCIEAPSASAFPAEKIVNKTKCECALEACLGEDNARSRGHCSAALAAMASASSKAATLQTAASAASVSAASFLSEDISGDATLTSSGEKEVVTAAPARSSEPGQYYASIDTAAATLGAYTREPIMYTGEASTAGYRFAAAVFGLAAWVL